MVKYFHQKKDRRRKVLKRSVKDPKVILIFLMKKPPSKVRRKEAHGLPITVKEELVELSTDKDGILEDLQKKKIQLSVIGLMRMCLIVPR